MSSWEAKPIRCYKYTFEWNLELTGDAHVRTTPLLDGIKYTLTIENSWDRWTVQIDRDGQPAGETTFTVLRLAIIDGASNKEYTRSIVVRYREDSRYSHHEITNLSTSIDHVLVRVTILMFPDYETGEIEANLSTDLVGLLQNPKLTDFSIKLEQGNQMPALKSILAARSKVFEMMLSHQLKETQADQMDLSEMPQAVVRQLVEFIHTGLTKFENLGLHGQTKTLESELTGEAMQLLNAAHCYEIERLKRICWMFLRSRVSVKCAAKLLQMSDSLGIPELRDSVLNHIATNRKRCARDPSLRELMDSDAEIRNQIVLALAGILPGGGDDDHQSTDEEDT